MKKHPAVIDDTGAWRQSDTELRDLTAGLLKQLAFDESARSDWLERQAVYYSRRYCREGRGTSRPWPGASDIVMPTIDMTIDRIKSTLYRVIFTNPMVVFEARNSISQGRARDAEVFFRWLLNDGIRDFRRQITIALDSVLQYGHAIVKVYWDYACRNQKTVLHRRDVPLEYRRIIQDTQDDKQPLTDLEQELARFTQMQVSLDDHRQFIKANKERFRKAIARWWELDLEEKEDADAASKILAFLGNSEEKVIFKSKEVLYNAPRVVTVAPEDFIVPRGTKNLQDATRIAQDIWLTESAFKSKARDLGWSDKAVDYVLDNRRLDERNRRSDVKRSILDLERDEREGLLSIDPADLIQVREIYWLDDIDGDGRDERVMMHVHPGTQTALRTPRESPFRHGLYPYVQLAFELNDERFYSSRGVPEKIDDIDYEITFRHRNKLNSLQLMVPTFKYRYGSSVNPDNMEFTPGACFPVMSMDDFEAVQVPDRTILDEREENILLTWNQRYLGGLDTGLSEQANISEARTATEIQAIQRSASETLSYRAAVLQLGLRDVYNMVWDLWNQWGPDEVYMRVTGGPMRRMSKAELRGDFSISPVGSITTTDPQAEAQRALGRMNVLMTLKEKFGDYAVGNEFDIDIAQLVQLWLSRENPLDAQAILRRRSPQEAQAIAQRDAQLQAMAARVQANSGITPTEMIQATADAKKALPYGARTKLVGEPVKMR